MTVTIERCGAGERADAIQDLFERNNRPDFPAVYARAYHWWMARGGASWVGLDETGRVVLHVAVFPRDFAGDGRRLRGGVLGDLMADPAHRTFWAPVQMLRTAVADIVAEDGMDFLISDPTPLSAGILRAAGFVSFGALRRLMLPLVPPYLAYRGWRSAARRLDFECLVLGDPRVDGLLRNLQPAAAFRAARSTGSVATRVPGENITHAEWVLMSDAGTPVALALVSTSEPRHVQSVVDIVWAPDRVGLASAALALARHARRHGFHRLGATVLEHSRAATELARAGFLRRDDTHPFVVRPLRAGLVLPPVDQWWLTPLEGSAW